METHSLARNLWHEDPSLRLNLFLVKSQTSFRQLDESSYIRLLSSFTINRFYAFSMFHILPLKQLHCAGIVVSLLCKPSHKFRYFRISPLFEQHHVTLLFKESAISCSYFFDKLSVVNKSLIFKVASSRKTFTRYDFVDII